MKEIAEIYGQMLETLRGITRKGGHKAEGVLRFRLEGTRPDALTIPAGVVCTTAGLVRFVTTEEGVIPAGALYADVAAEAESVGTAGNVPAQSVTFLTKAPTGVSGVTNPAAFQGGSGDEDDESLRERILDSFLRLPNGANARFLTRAWTPSASVRATAGSVRSAWWGLRRTARRSRRCWTRSSRIWTACARSPWMCR